MSRTFEEQAGEELDALYQGALFLSSGRQDEAERLLVGAVEAAFEKRGALEASSRSGRWLEAHLLEEFLDRHGGAARTSAPGGGAAAPRAVVSEVDPARLFEAAASIPPMARAALWLVLLRRWRYAEATDALGVDEEELRVLLGYRHALMAAVLSRPTRRSGTDGTETR